MRRTELDAACYWRDEARAWIAYCGGSRAAYVERYGSATDAQIDEMLAELRGRT